MATDQLQQRRDALREANYRRVSRAKLKRRVASGQVGLSSVMVDLPDYMENARVLEFLRAVPRIGAVRSRRILRGMGLTESVRFSQLQEWSQRRLREHLPS